MADGDQSRVGQAYQAAKTARRLKKGAEAARAGALLFNPWTWIVIGVAAVILLLALIVGTALAGIAASNGGKKPGTTGGGGSSGAVPGLADISDINIQKAPCDYGSAPGGCYKLPSKTKYWEAYSSYLTGSKCLVELVAATSKAWKLSHPGDTVRIGDLNAPGHASHSTGEDVDIHTDKAANMELSGYSADLSVDYGKLWFSTREIEYIFFNDDTVRPRVNGYAKSNGFPGVMQSWPHHKDHFHVRVTPGGDGGCGRG